MRQVVTLCLLTLAAVQSGVSLSAHHSFAAEFDENKPITLKGTILKMEWVNPHSWLYIDVKRADGKTETWALEFGSPNQLYRRGWTRESLPVGTEVTVSGWLSRTDPRTANAGAIVLPDGSKLFAGSPGSGAPVPNR
ncbi:MAG: hypothetical protein HYY76_17720 [Acidobacteria bacterium]|nr:hypothetical protein [Acidobacteriota bacterium]